MYNIHQNAQHPAYRTFSALQRSQCMGFTHGWQKCHPKSYFFQTVQNFGNFHSKTPNRLEFEKKVPKCPYFYGFCHWKTPYFLPCMHKFVWGDCCSLKQGQKLKNLYFRNRIVQFGEYFEQNIGTQAARFYFSLTGLKGLREGLINCVYVHVLETINIQACMD